jgi:hypothetical protein
MLGGINVSDQSYQDIDFITKFCKREAYPYESMHSESVDKAVHPKFRTGSGASGSAASNCRDSHVRALKQGQPAMAFYNRHRYGTS